MALRSSINDPSVQRAGIASLSFNQDNTCLAIATTSGILIYSLQLHQCIYKHAVGAVSKVEMLFCTSLLAYVGAGLQPALTPRKLTLLNTATSTTIQDISFSNVVLSVLINKSRLVAVLEQQACVYALHNLAHISTIDTPNNPRGIGALSTCDLPCLLALPAGAAQSGILRVYNLLCGEVRESASSSIHAPPQTTYQTTAGLTSTNPLDQEGTPGAVSGSSVLCEVHAHTSPLAAVALYHDSSLLATASTKGTVLRVHRMPQASCVAEFRRGSVPATIHAICWSPPNVQPPLLAASSSRGTVHIFRLDEEVTYKSSGPASPLTMRGSAGVAAGLMSAVMRLSPIPHMIGPQPSIASIRLPSDSRPATIGLLPKLLPAAQHPRQAATAADLDMHGTQDLGSDSTDEAGRHYDADAAVLVVATLGGILYEYTIGRLHSTNKGQTPLCTLEGEWALRDTSGGGALEPMPVQHHHATLSSAEDDER